MKKINKESVFMVSVILVVAIITIMQNVKDNDRTRVSSAPVKEEAVTIEETVDINVLKEQLERNIKGKISLIKNNLLAQYPDNADSTYSRFVNEAKEHKEIIDPILFNEFVSLEPLIIDSYIKDINYYTRNNFYQFAMAQYNNLVTFYNIVDNSVKEEYNEVVSSLYEPVISNVLKYIYAELDLNDTNKHYITYLDYINIMENIDINRLSVDTVNEINNIHKSRYNMLKEIESELIALSEKEQIEEMPNTYHPRSYLAQLEAFGKPESTVKTDAGRIANFTLINGRMTLIFDKNDMLIESNIFDLDGKLTHSQAH